MEYQGRDHEGWKEILEFLCRRSILETVSLVFSKGWNEEVKLKCHSDPGTVSPAV